MTLAESGVCLLSDRDGGGRVFGVAIDGGAGGEAAEVGREGGGIVGRRVATRWPEASWLTAVLRVCWLDCISASRRALWLVLTRILSSRIPCS